MKVDEFIWIWTDIIGTSLWCWGPAFCGNIFFLKGSYLLPRDAPRLSRVRPVGTASRVAADVYTQQSCLLCTIGSGANILLHRYLRFPHNIVTTERTKCGRWASPHSSIFCSFHQSLPRREWKVGTLQHITRWIYNACLTQHWNAECLWILARELWGYRGL